MFTGKSCPGGPLRRTWSVEPCTAACIWQLPAASTAGSVAASPQRGGFPWRLQPTNPSVINAFNRCIHRIYLHSSISKSLYQRQHGVIFSRREESIDSCHGGRHFINIDHVTSLRSKSSRHFIQANTHGFNRFSPPTPILHQRPLCRGRVLGAFRRNIHTNIIRGVLYTIVVGMCVFLWLWIHLTLPYITTKYHSSQHITRGI